MRERPPSRQVSFFRLFSSFLTGFSLVGLLFLTACPVNSGLAPSGSQSGAPGTENAAQPAQTGTPIDIPVPIAKSDEGVDPSSLHFVAISHDLVTSGNVGTVTGLSSKRTSGLTVSEIVDGKIKASTVTDATGSFSFTVTTDQVGQNLSLAGCDSAQCASISFPVVVNISHDDSTGYTMRVVVTMSTQTQGNPFGLYLSNLSMGKTLWAASALDTNLVTNAMIGSQNNPDGYNQFALTSSANTSNNTYNFLWEVTLAEGVNGSTNRLIGWDLSSGSLAVTDFTTSPQPTKLFNFSGLVPDFGNCNNRTVPLSPSGTKTLAAYFDNTTFQDELSALALADGSHHEFTFSDSPSFVCGDFINDQSAIAIGSFVDGFGLYTLDLTTFAAPHEVTDHTNHPNGIFFGGQIKVDPSTKSKVYFLCLDPNTFMNNLCRVNTDGSGSTTVITGDQLRAKLAPGTTSDTYFISLISYDVLADGKVLLEVMKFPLNMVTDATACTYFDNSIVVLNPQTGDIKTAVYGHNPKAHPTDPNLFGYLTTLVNTTNCENFFASDQVGIFNLTNLQ